MAIAKLGITPDGTTFEEQPLQAASVIAADGTTAQTHIADTVKHVTSSDKTKWNAAQANIIEKITRNGTALTPSSKSVNIVVPTKTSELTNDSSFLTTSSSLNAAKLTGLIPIASMPPAALERMIVVASDTARFALTASNAQVGDTVKVTATNAMYFIVDDTKLSSEAGYQQYTAGGATSVPWSGITSKPTTLSGYGITNAEPLRTTATQAEAEAGTGTTVRGWTPQRVSQAATAAAKKVANAAVAAAPKDIVVVASVAEIATSGARPGGIVLMKA